MREPRNQNRSHLSVMAASLAAVAALWWLTVSPEVPENGWRLYSIGTLALNLAATLAVSCGIYLSFGAGPRRKRQLKLMALCLSATLCAVLLELPALIAGVDYGDVLGTSRRNLWLELSRPDPELIHIHPPDSSYQGESLGNLVHFGIPAASPYSVDLRYDRNGFRNDHDLTKVETAVIGDSFVEAILLPAKQTVTARLAQRLGRTVVNLGQSAYGLQQELEVLRRFALPLAPQQVLWFFFGGNDLRDVAYYDRQREHWNDPPAVVPLRRRLFSRNAMLAISALLTPASLRAIPAERARTRSGIFTTANGRRETIYFGQATDDWTPEQWQVAVSTLSEAARLCREAGSEMTLVYVPRKFSVYSEFLEVDPGSLIAGWHVNQLPAAMAGLAADLGIGFVDTTPPLRALVGGGEHAYLLDDVHWNARGHAVAAEAIAQSLLGDASEAG